jgi:hypothetical protein
VAAVPSGPNWTPPPTIPIKKNVMLCTGMRDVYCEDMNPIIHVQPVDKIQRPITVAARSKALTVFACLNAGIVGSNPTRGMDVCLRLFCVCVVQYVGSGLATG